MKAPTTPPQIFDRRRYRQRRDRTAQSLSDASFLHTRVEDDIVDRLETVTRRFPRALVYGAHAFSSRLTPACGIDMVHYGDLAASRIPHAGIVCDEELWPFAPKSLDLVISILTLHHCNDLVGALSQMRQSLKPNGLFIGAVFGENTLIQLKHALYTAEAELLNGVSSRVSPFAAIRDLGGALQRAGFALPVADIDTVSITYSDPTSLFRDLRAMGETSVLAAPTRGLRKAVMTRALSILQSSDAIQFDVVYVTGWAPDASQQKPLRPGAAKQSLEEAIKKGLDEA